MRVLSAFMACVVLGCGSSDTTATPDPTDAELDGAIDGTSNDGTPSDGTSNDVAQETSDASGDAAGDPPVEVKTFTEEDGDVLNPERGWFDGRGIGLVDTTNYEGIRTAGFTVAYGKARLDAFKTKSIDASWLTQLDAGLARVRKAGIKVALRFVYNDGDSGDASETQVLQHIGQLAPTLKKNADVIAVLQAGLIGLWGEWHGSTSGLENPSSRKKIVEALLAAMPESRMVQIRTPHFKAEIWKDPLADADAFSGKPQARVAHHNDCVFASESDMGTYLSPVATWKTWLENDVKHLAMGGESCNLTDLSKCDNAKKELARFRWSFYNVFWHPDVYKRWGTDGCRDEIGKKLGYRIVLDEAALPKAVKPGGVIPLRLKLRNVGYAPMYNERPVRVVLDDGKTRRVVSLGIDARRWAPGAPISIDVRLRVPADVAIGKALLELWLPDAYESIASRPEYAVRIASKGVWDAKTGTNVLSDALAIDPSAPGTADPTAKDFAKLP